MMPRSWPAACRPSAPGQTHNARGFTLVETLVAVVVLAIGLLGMARLSVDSLRAVRRGTERAAAVLLAGDMADRIRLNPTGPYAGTGPGADQGCTTGQAQCTPQQLADDDWHHWSTELHRVLPAGARAHIERHDDAVAGTLAITLHWPAPGQVDAASYTLVLQP